MMNFFNRGYYSNDMMERFSDRPWVGLLVGGICMLIVAALIITAIIIIVRVNRRSNATHMIHNAPPPAPPKNEAALKLLDERYAKSEIGDDEYKTKKQNLIS